MELKTYKVKNEKLYKMLLEKKEIVDEGRKLSEELEPLYAKIKPMQEKMQELEKKLQSKESKMMPLVEKDAKKISKDFSEFEDLTMFQAGEDKNEVFYKTIDVIEKTKEQFLENKKKNQDKKDK